MTLFTTMPSLIEVSAQDFGGGRVLTNTDLDRVTARVLATDSTEVLTETELTWDAPSDTWQLVWTTPVGDGTYTLEVRGYGIGEDNPTPVYKRLRVAKRPVSE
jgi:hypothetical protein